MQAFKVEYFLHSFLGTLFLLQWNNHVPQKTLKHCLVLGGGVKKWLSRPSAVQDNSIKYRCHVGHVQSIVKTSSVLTI